MTFSGWPGGQYWYFFCRGAQDHVCDAPYSNVARVEAAIERHYETVRFRPEFIASVLQSMAAAPLTLTGRDNSYKGSYAKSWISSKRRRTIC